MYTFYITCLSHYNIIWKYLCQKEKYKKVGIFALICVVALNAKKRERIEIHFLRQ